MEEHFPDDSSSSGDFERKDTDQMMEQPVTKKENFTLTSNNKKRKNSGRVYNLGKVRQEMTLIHYLVKKVRSQCFKESAWERRVVRGDIILCFDDAQTNSSCCKNPNQLLSAGTEVHYHRRSWYEPILPDMKHNKFPFQILYQDEDVLAIHKPSGIPTMPSQTFNEYTILHQLRAAMNTEPPPQPVHRLGVGTSGLLLIATSIKSRKILSQAIRERRVKKYYRALVSNGKQIPNQMRIECPIGPIPFPIGGGTLYAACPGTHIGDGGSASKKSKPSLSLVRVIRRDIKKDQAVVEVEIPTGRPHQIRIHMAYAGYPLVGDPLYLNGGLPCMEKKYFSKRDPREEDMDSDDDVSGEGEDGMLLRVSLPRDCGYCLHAYRMIFEHPTIDGQWMTITAPPPDHL
jgi:23S rRNA pseudouridine1911/1915/1917 synthase